MQSALCKNYMLGACEGPLMRVAMPARPCPSAMWRPQLWECRTEQQHSFRVVATSAKRSSKSKTTEPSAAVAPSEDVVQPQAEEPARKKRGRPKSVAKMETTAAPATPAPDAPVARAAPAPPPPAAAAPPAPPPPTVISTLPHVGLVDIDSSRAPSPGAGSDQDEVDLELETQHRYAPPAPSVPGSLQAQPPQTPPQLMPVQPLPQTAAQQAEEASGSYGITAGLPDDGYEKTALREYLGYDLYRPLRSDAEELALLPRKVLPKTDSVREMGRLKYNLVRNYWTQRKLHQEYVLSKGFEAHHLSRENGVNIYANTRRIAGIMAEFENDDFKLQNLAPDNFAAWARSEMVFQSELEEFNQLLTQHADEIGKRPLREAQEEEIDLLDEALFLLSPDDDNAAAERAGQQSAEQMLLDEYLEGLLPGATLDNLSAAYAEDIFSTERDDYYDDDTAAVKPAADEAAGADAVEA